MTHSKFAVIQIMRKTSDEVLAIFDVSPTIEYEFVAVSDKEWGAVEQIGRYSKLMEFMVKEVTEGSAIVSGADFLELQAQNEGFDSWADYMSDQAAKEAK